MSHNVAEKQLTTYELNTMVKNNCYSHEYILHFCFRLQLLQQLKHMSTS